MTVGINSDLCYFGVLGDAGSTSRMESTACCLQTLGWVNTAFGLMASELESVAHLQ